MKIMKNRYGLLRFFTLLFILLSFTSVIYFPQAITNSGYFNWLFLLLCLLLFCIPIKTPRDIYHLSLKKPFVLVSLLQWSSLGIYYGMTQLCGSWLPLYTEGQINFFQDSAYTIWIHYGFFPWPIIALFTTVLSRHIKEQDAYPHLLLQPLIASETDNASGLLFNTLTRSAFILLIGVIIAICAIVTTYLIAPNTLMQALGFQPVILICLVALFAFTASKQAQHYWRLIATNPLIKPFMILLGLAILLGIALFIALLVSAILKVPPQKNLSIMQYLLETGWRNYWDITNYCFWLLWIMPLSLYFTELLKTATRQKIILIVMTWPIIWALILLIDKHINLPLNLPIPLNIAILLISSALFFILISHKVFWQTTSRGYTPRLEKIRPTTKLLRNIALLTVITLYLFWQSGIIGLSFLLVFIALPIGFLCLLSLVNLGGR